MSTSAKVWIAYALEILGFGALLFGAAGTFRWPAAWAFLAVFTATTAPMLGPLLRHDPELLKERMKPPIQEGQPLWDRILLPTIFVLFFAWLVLIGLDAGRFHWSAMPQWLQWAGGVGLVIALWASFRVSWENSYLSASVKIQEGRGHKVISTGPYAIVRHPFYTASILLFASIPLMLGSWYGLGGAAVLSLILVFRTVLEDRKLHDELEGYREYAGRVRYRLIPGIW